MNNESPYMKTKQILADFLAADHALVDAELSAESLMTETKKQALSQYEKNRRFAETAVEWKIRDLNRAKEQLLAMKVSPKALPPEYPYVTPANIVEQTGVDALENLSEASRQLTKIIWDISQSYDAWGKRRQQRQIIVVIALLILVLLAGYLYLSWYP